MEKELIMNSDVLDILFENKNKDYGAYSLRKFLQQSFIQIRWHHGGNSFPAGYLFFYS